MDTLKKLERNGVHFNYEDIVSLCMKYKIVELSIFGSSLREDFKEDSDIDVLVRYAPRNKLTLIDEVHIIDELQIIFDRDVDLVAVDGLKNPIRRKNILESSELVYAYSR